ncbi:MAG: DsrE family protein [Sphingobacteriales bacterium]|nr:DsrE family protein [Sphingobacteriales bacterium]
MKKQILLLLLFVFTIHLVKAQTILSDSLRLKKDSTLKAMIHQDSQKVEKQFEERARREKITKSFEYPLIKGGKYSGVLPVKNLTEIPDPNMDYKLLFEITKNNPDSLMKMNNGGLDEVARVLNLHYASGIPQKRLIPVIVVHGGALNALLKNEAYQKKYKIDNPNTQIINDLQKLGTKFIVCGQAMQFLNIDTADLLPGIKLSLTAQTVITNYQLKGYVLLSE